MGNIFIGSEMVELGIQIEYNGRDFYGALAVKTKNSSSQEVFKFLAKEEEKHVLAFKKILSSLEEHVPAESYSGEYVAYMKALAADYIFTRKGKGEEAANSIKGEREAVDLGIGFEKDSIVFYQGMKQAVPDYDVKVLDELIRQEQNHLLLLMGLKNKL